MSLDILKKILSMRNLKRYFEPRNASAATATANNWLYILCASKVKQYSDGRYTIQNIKVRSAIILVGLLGWDLYGTIHKFKVMGLNFNTYYSVFTWIQFIYLVVAANCRTNNQLCSYYNNLDAIDNYINKNDYEQDKRETNTIFFAFLLLRVSCYFLEGWAWTAKLGFSLTWTFYVKNNMSVYIYMDYISYVYKINLLKIRVHAMLKRICNINPYKDTDEESYTSLTRRRCLEKVNQEMKSCYIKTFEQCDLLNVTDGIQVMLMHADVLIHSIYLISSTVTAWNHHESGSTFVLASAATRFGVHMLLLVTALAILRRIAQDLEKTHLVIHNKFLQSTNSTAAERQSWLEFSELLRRNPLVFTAYDIFVLDFSLLVRMFGMIITNTIIMTQFKSEPKNDK